MPEPNTKEIVEKYAKAEPSFDDLEVLRPYKLDFIRLASEPVPLSDPRDIDKIIKHMAVRYVAMRLVMKYGFLEK